MSHPQNSLSGVSQDGHHVVSDAVTESFIEGGKWFVEQDQLGLGSECSCECDSLLHASGQFGRVAVLSSREVYHVEHFGHASTALRRPTIFESESDVLPDSEMRKERTLLCHDSNSAMLWWHKHIWRAHDLVADAHGPVKWSLEARDDS
jgi:hypothetical protein